MQVLGHQRHFYALPGFQIFVAGPSRQQSARAEQSRQPAVRRRSVLTHSWVRHFLASPSSSLRPVHMPGFAESLSPPSNAAVHSSWNRYSPPAFALSLCRFHMLAPLGANAAKRRTPSGPWIGTGARPDVLQEEAGLVPSPGSFSGGMSNTDAADFGSLSMRFIMTSTGLQAGR